MQKPPQSAPAHADSDIGAISLIPKNPLADTQPPTTGDMSLDEWPLRTAALKMTGQVESDIAEARTLVESQDSPTDPADLCTACFHWCHGLLWTGRYDDARQILNTHFRPAASITDARWMAWADYVEACVLAASGTGRHADQAIALAHSALPGLPPKATRMAASLR
jgi:hypothetical protein